MNTLTAPRYFHKLYKHLLGGQIRAKEALIYSIISEFEEAGLPCFLSRTELAKRINESEATAERSLQTLIKAGWIVTSRKGRLRYLRTSEPST